MFKIAAILAILCWMSVANAGLVTTHHFVHEPVLAKVAHVVHSSPSAVSHQSITQLHGKKAVVEPIVAPIVKTTIHNAPVIHTPTVHTYPVIHSIPVVHSAPLLTVYH